MKDTDKLFSIETPETIKHNLNQCIKSFKKHRKELVSVLNRYAKKRAEGGIKKHTLNRTIFHIERALSKMHEAGRSIGKQRESLKIWGGLNYES